MEAAPLDSQPYVSGPASSVTLRTRCRLPRSTCSHWPACWVGVRQAVAPSSSAATLASPVLAVTVVVHGSTRSSPPDSAFEAGQVNVASAPPGSV